MFLYKSIKKSLLQAQGHPQGNALRRLNSLAAMITGMIKSSKSHLESLGSGLPQDIDAESRVKHVKRWLLSKKNTYKVHFLPCIDPVLKSRIAKNIRLTFAIDGSGLANGCTVLMISLCVGKRAIPICWLVRQCKKGHLPADTHVLLFELLKELLNGYDKVVIVGDGEFDNHQIIELCDAEKWDFVLRTAKNTKIDDGEEQYPIKNLHPFPGHKFMCVADVYYTLNRYGPVCASVLVKKKGEDPIYVLSSFELSFEMAHYYKKRWSIETFFKDVKSKGFFIDKSKLSDPQRVKKLVMIACLAYILIFRLGLNEQNSPLIPKVTRKDRMDLSIFTLGKKLVDHCIKRSINIIFSFSKNCYIVT